MRENEGEQTVVIHDGCAYLLTPRGVTLLYPGREVDASGVVLGPWSGPSARS